MARRPLSRFTKINIGWGILVVVGITSFAVARTLVQNQRYEVMKSKQRVRDACKQDVLDAEAKTVS
uniref:Uncharacterized protein n=1 Tax=Octopus bimaculoides TaxID=37653 RepID=A0A0L8G7Z7_OCTBM